MLGRIKKNGEIRKTYENWIKCGRCNTEFDLSKNDGCPLCGFGSKGQKASGPMKTIHQLAIDIGFLEIPPVMDLKPAVIVVNKETAAVGSWGMFNSFFPGKASLRVLAHMMDNANTEFIILQDLIDKIKEILLQAGYNKLRGFPNNPEKENSIGRLVNHFIRTYTNMGLFNIRVKTGNNKNVWNNKWSEIEITLSKEGLEFARLHNRIFDYKESFQTLTKEEKEWMIAYLKRIDKEGYKEYTMLKNIFEFLKEGHNGKDDLWDWFQNNEVFRNYIKWWSRKKDDSEALENQIKNLSMTFAVGKIALLRELGIVNNKRNDYTIVEDLQ